MALMHSRTPDVPGLAAAAGYDAVYIDLEHTATPLETVAMLCAAAAGADISALVRVPSHDPSVIARVLDIGAVGVIVPHVNSKSEAESVVHSARFPPAGRRSISGPNPVTGFRPRTAPELAAEIDRYTVVAAMVETPQAVESVDDIAAVAGLDMILLGPSDLTAEMGIHGDFENHRFHEAVGAVAEACREHGVAFGIAGIRSPDLLAHFVDLGLRFISAGTDVGMLTDAASARARELRALHRSHRT
ncbi:HpcH/HpaI aldolase family protein [Mycolicibacterium thermoresistibile]|uniref:HpcH/HpaI aldolase n=2 Tax=Mycolicibacterium thermoresistibile TaxID=1797 RepID=G7CN31_MYCT3|nr:aldolase/citrate lyase family protein [Mycolicibacterium thermoresistibile]EHI10520.1 HpcH/HpaI aldolase [Mycolicibacterium thermoresistibile ATCC 19527]GAT15428.1 hpcH/HpaI aldolase [Mycolicibacterium thermoresistibile]SNW17487.1 hpcH/HpaI aldolase [Mycolicibacterium thermoresistibile]